MKPKRASGSIQLKLFPELEDGQESSKREDSEGTKSPAVRNRKEAVAREQGTSEHVCVRNPPQDGVEAE
jgi:hypothetical protein